MNTEVETQFEAATQRRTELAPSTKKAPRAAGLPGHRQRSDRFHCIHLTVGLMDRPDAYT